MKHIRTIFVLLALLTANISAQVLFTETFNYRDGVLDAGNALTPGGNVSGGNWVFCGSSSSALLNMIAASGTGLTYPGYDLSGKGKLITLSNDPADLSQDRCYRQFPAQTGKIYYSLLLNVTDLNGIPSVGASKGDYFVVLWPSSSTSNSNSFGALSIRMADSVTKQYQLGVRAFQTASSSKWAPNYLDAAKTYLVVVSYDIISDSVKLWINPALTATEPAANADTSGTDKTEVARIGFYQRQTGPHATVSGLRVANSWTEAIFATGIEEIFDYANGGLDAGSLLSPRLNVSKGVWLCGTTSAFTDSLSVETGALVYPGYSLSGAGKKVFLPNDLPATSNDRAYISFAPLSNKFYYSMMVNLKDATNLSSNTSTDGEYFTGFWPSNSSSNANYRGLLCIRAGSAPNTYQLGIRATQPTGNSSTSWVQWDLNVGSTYLIIVSYEKGTSPMAKLWINPVLNGTEPNPSAASGGTISTDISDIGRFGIYQRGSKPHIYLGGLRVFTKWDFAPVPVELASFSAVKIKNGIQLNWITATELNNAGFDVERRNSNSAVWAKIGHVAGSGNSTITKAYSFVDENLANGKYIYRLKQIDHSGSFNYYGNVETEILAVFNFNLSEAYPNPFNPSTRLDFSVALNGKTTLKVYNCLGQLVATLFDGFAEAGKLYNVSFNSSTLSSGVYFARLESSNNVSIKRLMLIK